MFHYKEYTPIKQSKKKKVKNGIGTNTQFNTFGLNEFSKRYSVFVCGWDWYTNL